jgi:hypothetical protein
VELSNKGIPEEMWAVSVKYCSALSLFLQKVEFAEGISNYALRQK